MRSLTPSHVQPCEPLHGKLIILAMFGNSKCIFSFKNELYNFVVNFIRHAHLKNLWINLKHLGIFRIVAGDIGREIQDTGLNFKSFSFFNFNSVQNNFGTNDFADGQKKYDRVVVSQCNSTKFRQSSLCIIEHRNTFENREKKLFNFVWLDFETLKIFGKIKLITFAIEG